MSYADAGGIKASIDFDAAGLERAVNRAMAKATKHIDNSIDTSMEHVESRMTSGFRRVGGMIVGLMSIDVVASKLLQAGTYIATLGQQTEKTLNTFQATTQATGTQMKRVSDLATELGNDISIPGASAADAAKAMTELAKAGMTVDQSMAAAKGSLQLAAAAQIEAAEAATIEGEALNAFGLAANKAGHVADVLANSANASAAEISDTADALAQAGAVAHAAGFSIEETTTLLSQFANAGIKGSDAGTLLKQMLLQLQSPTGKAAQVMKNLGLHIYDANGDMLSARSIIAQLIQATDGLTQSKKDEALATIFGSDAVRGANVLIEQGIKVHDEVAKAIGRQGAAQDLAAARAKGLTGALNGLVSTVESLAIEIYQNVSPAMNRWLRGVLDDLPGVIDQATTYVSALIDALEPAARIVAAFIEAAKPGVIVAFKAALATLLGVVRALTLPLEPLADLLEANQDALTALVGPIVAVTIAYKAFSRAVNGIRTFRTQQVDAFAKSVDRLKTKFAGASTVASRFRVVGGGLVGAMGGPWGIAIGVAATAIGVFAAHQAEARRRSKELTDTLNEQTGAVTKHTRKLVADRLAQEGAFDAAKKLGIGFDRVLDAVISGGPALDNLIQRLWKIQQANTDTYATSSSVVHATNAQGDAAKRLAAALGDQGSAMSKSIAAAKRKAHEDRQAAKAVNGLTAAEKAEKDAAISAATSKSRLAKVQGQLSRNVDTTAKSIRGEGRAAQFTKAAIQALNQESIKGINAQIDFEQASDDLRKQIRSLSPAAIRTGKALDVQTQAGRDTYRAFIDLALASKDVDGGMKRARRQIYRTIRPMVDSKAEAWRLTNQFFDLKQTAEDVPSRVRTHVSAPGLDAALGKANAYYRKLLQIDGSFQSRVETVYTYTGARYNTRAPGGRYATGGRVSGPGTATSDSILARLSDGEYVVRAAAVDKYGTAFFNAVNAMRFADGGEVRASLPRMAPVTDQAAGNSLVENLTVEVGTSNDLPEALDETLFHLRRIKRGGRYATTV